MKLELSDKEVREIGENRWLNKHWGKFMITIMGSLVILMAILIPLAILDIENRDYIAYPLIILWGGIYILGLIKVNKEGKKFLKEQQQ